MHNQQKGPVEVTADRASCWWRNFKSHNQIRLAAALWLALTITTLPASARRAIKSYEVEKTVYNICNQSDALINSKSYARARDILLQAAAYDPTSYSAYIHLNLARCYRELGSSKQACREAETAVRFEPDSDDALYSVALNYYDLDYFDKASEYLNKVLSVSKDPEWRSRAQTKIGEIQVYRDVKAASRLINLGHDAQAIQLLEKAAGHDPTRFSPTIHANLTYALQRSGKSEQAIAHGKQALQLDPSDTSTIYTMAIAYQDMGNFDGAISWLRRYVSLETDERQRKEAQEFIQELADDRSKQDAAANNAPDYLDQLKENADVEKWPRAKLPLKVNLDPCKGVAGYKPKFRNYVIRSLDTWCQASGKKLNYVIVDNSRIADLRVVWTIERIMMRESGRNRSKAGITYVNSDDDGTIIDAKIRITTANGFSRKYVQDSEAASVAMHEVGHAFGLGHSSSVKDVMYFGSSSQQPGYPSARDRATIARLYAGYPAVSFTPKAPVATEPIKYLPPPAFVPPQPPAADKLVPPLFMPPPLRTAEDKLTPPLFTPPPLSNKQKSEPQRDRQSLPGLPLFVPPPLQKTGGEKSNSDKPDSGIPNSDKIPFFTPAPAH